MGDDEADSLRSDAGGRLLGDGGDWRGSLLLIGRSLMSGRSLARSRVPQRRSRGGQRRGRRLRGEHEERSSNDGKRRDRSLLLLEESR